MQLFISAWPHLKMVLTSPIKYLTPAAHTINMNITPISIAVTVYTEAGFTKSHENYNTCFFKSHYCAIKSTSACKNSSIVQISHLPNIGSILMIKHL